MSFHPIKGVPSVVYDFDSRVYHSAQTSKRGTPEFWMSRTELVRFGACPSRWKRGGDEDEPDEKTTAAMHFGDLFDVCVLTPERFEKRFAVAPETYPSKGMECPVCKSVTDSAKCRTCKQDRVEVQIDKPWNSVAGYCDDWKSEQEANGFTVVKPGKASEAWLAAKRHMEDEHIAAFHAVSKKQVLVQVQWEDDETRLCIPFKAMLDLVPDPDSEFGDTLADTKTSRDGSDSSWQRQVYNDGLHIQASTYLDAMNAAAGTNYRIFEHHITENKFPFETTHRRLSDDFIRGHANSGREVYQSYLREYCASIKSGKWRGLGTKPVEMELWMATKY